MPPKPQSKVERRMLTQEFRVSAEGEPATIAGYAALFNTPSDDFGYWTEEIDPTAFNALLTPALDCRALFNHDPNYVLGRTTAGTLSLTLDSRGLAYVIQPPDTQVARDLVVSMRRKDVTQSSFAFVAKRDQWTENSDGSVTRRILEFEQLLDVSPVTYPAYSGTTAQTRTMPASMPKEIRSRIQKRSDDDDDDAEANGNGCKCTCDQCRRDDCDNCSDPDCTDSSCTANEEERSRKVTASERRRMEMQLELARLT